MATFRFSQVDVFAEEPLSGNPLAVVHGADALDDGAMQALARWTNLSETAFLLRPSSDAADYRVRIFTPGGELPFAGHPTLGACHAWIEADGMPRAASEVVQECGVGLVRIRRQGERAAFEAPPLRIDPVEPELLAAVLAAIGVPREVVRDVAWLDNGPRWLALLLDSAERVLAIEPDHAALKALAKVGVAGPHAPGGAVQFEVRAFAAAIGIPEDPVTGSLNASLAEWLTAGGYAPVRYVAAQGARVGRAGRVHLERDEDHSIWVGGTSSVVIRGSIAL